MAGLKYQRFEDLTFSPDSFYLNVTLNRGPDKVLI